MPQGLLSTRHLHLSDLLGLLPWVPAGPVCDIGCGSGYLAAALAAYGLPVTALDVDRESVLQASKRYGEQVAWVHSDIRHYRLPRESHAAIFCLNVFPFIPNGERARLIGRLKAAVKPGGFLVLAGLSEADPAAGLRLARSVNRISFMPTGVFALRELEERFRDWEILCGYQGPALQSCLKEPALHQVCQIVARKPPETSPRSLQQLPKLGAGLGWQPERDRLAPDFVEIEADSFLELEEDAFLARLSQRLTVIPRSRQLSLGSPGLRQDGYIEALARLVARCGSPWWCEHLAFSHSEPWESYCLQPLPATEEALEVVKQNIRALRRRIPVPLLLEALPALDDPGGPADMDPATFLRHVAEEADCGLSLNVSRLWEQLQRSGMTAQSWLERLPRERVLQLRLDLGPVAAGVWELVQLLLAICPVRAICLSGDAQAQSPEGAQELATCRQLIGQQPGNGGR